MAKKYVGYAVGAVCCLGWGTYDAAAFIVQCCEQLNQSTGMYETVTAESCRKCPVGCNDLCLGTIDPPVTLQCADECKGMTDWGWPQGSITSISRYQTRCNGLACEYRCAAGYYGQNKNCTVCPGKSTVLIGDGDVSTSAAGTTVVTGCYATAGNDSSGDYEYTSPCYYK
ncbi:MAG: hypothetical protein K2L94_04925 [Alphaproteobacteria bacterium]|nr:hypothetical protein [Alphaproteobacteria bacterium]